MAIDITRSRRQDLIDREGYTKGARVGHCRERKRRRHGANYINQSIPTLYLGYINRPRVGDAFTLCRDSSKTLCRQDLISREGYTKGATEQCRKTSIDNTRRCRQRGEGSETSRYAGMDRDENCRKTAIDNTQSRRQDLIGREGYTKGATKQCRKTSIDNTRKCRQQGDGPVTSRFAGKGGDENCRKTAIDNTWSRRQDLIGREGYTKGATEQCRKITIDNTRSSRQDFIGRPRSIFNIFVWVLATQQ